MTHQEAIDIYRAAYKEAADVSIETSMFGTNEYVDPNIQEALWIARHPEKRNELVESNAKSMSEYLTDIRRRRLLYGAKSLFPKDDKPVPVVEPTPEERAHIEEKMMKWSGKKLPKIRKSYSSRLQKTVDNILKIMQKDPEGVSKVEGLETNHTLSRGYTIPVPIVVPMP